ncbi:hypothetical protein RIF29_38443 [Crotalaria pallida]|uniref:Uncharacterized protein n=1 Tax=Crotalaria pallida TaxID=3830 RepID=A0AAN9E5J4_CROPI
MEKMEIVMAMARASRALVICKNAWSIIFLTALLRPPQKLMVTTWLPSVTDLMKLLIQMPQPHLPTLNLVLAHCFQQQLIWTWDLSNPLTAKYPGFLHLPMEQLECLLVPVDRLVFSYLRFKEDRYDQTNLDIKQICRESPTPLRPSPSMINTILLTTIQNAYLKAVQ